MANLNLRLFISILAKPPFGGQRIRAETSLLENLFTHVDIKSSVTPFSPRHFKNWFRAGAQSEPVLCISTAEEPALVPVQHRQLAGLELLKAGGRIFRTM